jgi:hypothetical protein
LSHWRLVEVRQLREGGSDAGVEGRMNRHEILRMTELSEALDSRLTAGCFLLRRWQPGSRRSA